MKLYLSNWNVKAKYNIKSKKWQEKIGKTLCEFQNQFIKERFFNRLKRYMEMIQYF